LKLAYLTMMTYPGAPMLYYGDEIGLEGGRDPDCRRAMLWDPARWNHDLRAAVQRYIALRKRYAAVWRGGAYVHLYTQGMVYVFARQRDRHTVLVGLNAGTSEVTLDLDVQRLFPHGGLVRAEWSGQQYPVIDGSVRGLRIPARDGCIWVGEQPS
jgi:cyclomaltodextrinase